MEHICSINDAKDLKYNTNYYVVNKKPFSITENINCVVDNYKFSGNNNEGDLESYTFRIYSTDENCKLETIKEFIENLEHEWNEKRKYIYNHKQYYFNENNTNQPPKNPDGGYRYELAPKAINFTMSEFSTNRSMKNIFGSHLHNLKERVSKFIHNEEWYKKYGKPYTLGILLSGPPGTGKTSIIKAIAKDAGRHIININLRETTTKTQLNKLFFDNEITVNQSGEQGKEEKVYIPINKRLYVCEAIDCMNDIVYDREIMNFNTESEI